MGIDTFTFFAQIVNLAVLVFLLKIFLYKPILRVVQKRQAQIKLTIEQARRSESEAKTELLKLQEERNSFQKEKEVLFTDAVHQIERLKQQKEAEISALKERETNVLYQSLENEKKSAELKIRNLILQNFMDLSTVLVQEFGILTPTESLLKLFKKRIDSFSRDEKKKLLNYSKKAHRIFIRTAGQFSQEQQNYILADVSKFLKVSEDKFVFQIDESIIAGVEIQIDDLLIEWTLKSYLENMQETLNNEMILNQRY